MDGTPDLAGGQCLATAHFECQARALGVKLAGRRRACVPVKRVEAVEPWVLNRANRNCYGLGWLYPQTVLTSPCTELDGGVH
jgi:hypothetical protein